jgi:predicted transcriptional regulator of viral defense system
MAKNALNSHIIYVNLLWVIDMKYYKEIAEKEVFDSEYVKGLTNGKDNADKVIHNYQTMGYIKKVKHNLYATISLENGGLIPTKYKIACAINGSSFISHHSAFEFYGFYNQVFNTVNVTSLNRFHPFDFEGTEYQYLQSNSEAQVDLIRGVRVTSIERTIVDSINDVDKIAGTEELLKCIGMVSYVNEGFILDYLKYRSSKLLYKKVGYVLSHFNKKLKLSEGFFETCLLEGGKVIGYFSQVDKNSLVFISKWQIYAYDDLMSFIEKKDNFNV